MSGAPVQRKALMRAVVVLWPMWTTVGVAVHHHEEVMPGIRTEVDCDLLDGRGFIIIGSFVCDRRLSWHCLHERIRVSMSWFNPGQ